MSQLLQRPVAVIISSLALVVGGILALYHLPVSLLPPLETPRIIIRAHYPNASAQRMEAEVCTPIREELGHLRGVETVESSAFNHQAEIFVHFRFGTAMDLAFLEVNEKLDYLLPRLPADMPRPQAIRNHLSDIPLFHLQVIPVQEHDSLEIAQLAEKTIRRRIAQVPGVSMIDINGMTANRYEIRLNSSTLQATGIRPETIYALLQEASVSFGTVPVQEGPYQYMMQLGNPHTGLSDIQAIFIPLPNGTRLPLHTMAQIIQKPEKPEGYHLYNGKTGVVLRIFQQEQARMDELAPALEQLRQQLAAEFPNTRFVLTRNQYALLGSSIKNLRQALWIGGILAILILFAFYRNATYPLLMAISIPVSLCVTFLLFYLIGLTLNILSLAGLTLSIGMMIDNSIVVIDHIHQRRQEALGIRQISALGIRDALPAVIGQVLTSAAVYAPLVLLGGKAGALLSDQALAFSVGLGISLLTSFTLIPVVFYQLFQHQAPGEWRETLVMHQLITVQRRMTTFFIRHSILFFTGSTILGSLAVWLAFHLPGGTLPPIKEPAAYWHIQWENQITPAENLRRMRELHAQLLHAGATEIESDIGIAQFVLHPEQDALHRATLYVRFEADSSISIQSRWLEHWMRQHYPAATIRPKSVPNAFTYLFETDEPLLEARFQEQTPGMNPQKLDALERELAPEWRPAANTNSQPVVQLIPDKSRMQLYGITYDQIRKAIGQNAGSDPALYLHEAGEEHPLFFSQSASSIPALLEAPVRNKQGMSYPLNQLLIPREISEPFMIRAAGTGPFYAFQPQESGSPMADIKEKARKCALANGFTVQFTGRQISTQANRQRLPYLLLLSGTLLYLILAIQFEHLLTPLLVLLVMPIGLSGSLGLLYLYQLPIDLMASIGIVVVLGIISDDPILKLHTIRLIQRKTATADEAPPHIDAILEEASQRSLKPLLMTSLTTILALLPMLFAKGLGSELQKPLVLVVIGGLSISTIFSAVFIPLAYRSALRVKDVWTKKRQP